MTIDDSLFDELKARAARRGTTVSKLIEDSVRLALSAPQEGSRESAELELVTYGRGGRLTERDVNKTSELLEHDDIERYGTQSP